MFGQTGPDIGLHPDHLGYCAHQVGQCDQGQPSGQGSGIGSHYPVVNGASQS